MEEEIFSEEDQSEFNSSLAALQRCHEIKKWLDIMTLKNNHLIYYRLIKSFYKELSVMMTKEKEEQLKRWKKGKEIEAKLESGEKLDREEIDFLEQWELELRAIDQAKGMNISKMKDYRWGLSRR